MNKFLRVIQSELILSRIRKDLEINDASSKELKYLDFHRSRFDYILRLSDRYFKPGAKLLDLGSLFGHLCTGAKAIGYETSGLDRPESVSEFAPRFKQLDIKNIACNLEKEAIPCPDQEFDLVLASEILGHLNFHPARFFKEIERVLKPGGLLILSTPNLMRLNNVVKMFFGFKTNWDSPDDYWGDASHREFTAAVVVYLLKKSGLKIKRLEYKNFRHSNLSRINKLFNKLSGPILPHRKGSLVIVAKKPQSE